MSTPTDPSVIRKWRIDGIKALATRLDVSKARDARLPRLTQNIIRYIRDYFPAWRINERTEATLRMEVIMPAMEFEFMIHTSFHAYHFGDAGIAFEKQEVDVDSLAERKCTDVDTGKKLTPASPVVADEKGSIGEEVLVIEPMLYRMEGDKLLNLRPGHHLIELYHPLKRRRRGD